MAIDNTSIGSVLTIPDGLINNLEKVDDRIKKIQESARATGATFNTQFAGMTSNTNFLINNLDKIIGQLNTIGTAAQTASQATQGMGQGMGSATQGMSGFGTSITNVTQLINQMIGQLQSSGQIGTSQIMAVKLAWDKLQEAMQYKNTGNIAMITDEIKGIDKQLKDTENLLTKTEQDALVERKRLLQEELKEAQRTQKEREVNLQQTLDRMATAQERYNKRVEQSNKKAEYDKNTTFDGAIDFSKGATTINQRLKAIQYLREARANLSTTEADYAAKLEKVNAAIKLMDKLNRDAVASSKNLGTAYESLTKSHHNLLDTAGQLQRAFALMFSVSQIRGYISQIAKVRGEFELQQRSLEAILQNKTEADAIFNKTVALAVQSPFQIKDLISYTKQLAAYRIESDKLYDTTKRLADVSAGLGVDMQRLILAYGQVKAAAYLRGTEVRQFTEAGINLYGELQAYFKEVKGEAYTTAQIVDMISKRMVTFEDVEAIFRRITDQGGIFYNMQAIQAETLQGKIANLKDSIDVMLNDIGKANEGTFKGTIDVTNKVIRNWQTLADVGKALIVVLGALKLNSMMVGKTMSAQFLELAQFEKVSKATNGLKLLGIAWKNAGIAAKAAGIMMKEAFMANAWLLAIGAVVDVLYQLYERNEQYKQSLSKTNSEYAAAATQVRKLADEYRALSATSKETADGEIANASERRAALEELVATMQKANMTIGFNVNTVSDADLDKYFESSLKRYEAFLKTKQLLEYRYNKDIRDTWFADDIQEDAKDYEDAYNEVAISLNKVEDAVARVGVQYKNLSIYGQEAYDQLTAERPKGMDDVEYLEKQLRLLQQIRKEQYNPGLKYSQQTDLYQYLSVLTQLREKLREAKSAKDELLRIENIGGKQMWVGELAGDLKILQAQYKQAVQDGINEGMTKAQAQKRAAFDIKTQIDEMAVYRQWGDMHKNLLYMAGSWKYPIVFDEQKAKKQIDSIKKQMDDAFANNTYTVTIRWDKQELSDDQAWKEFDKNAQQSLDKLKTLVDKRNKLKNGTIQLDGYDPKAENATINDLYNYISKLGDGYKALADQIMGYNKKTTNTNKIQRDILSEQISLLKEMQSRYDSLREVMGDEKAQSSVLSYYKESLKYVKMPSGIVNTFVPTKQGVIDALNKLIPTITDFKKRMEAKNLVAQFKVELQKEELQRELDAAKQQIDDAFSGLNAYTDLKKLGLGESDIAKMFGDLPKTFDDVQKKIAEVYNGKEGEDWAKQRQETEKKLQEQVVKYNLDTFKELTKAYKNNLSDQLQLDEWYYEERRKIQENEQLRANPEMQKQYLGNLDKQYAEKSDANSWKQFQESEYYIKIFENLDVVSSRVLKEMSSRLENIRGSLKNLSPEQLKQVVSATEQINTQLVSRNPFKGLLKNIKEYAAFQKKRNDLEQKFIDSSAKETNLQSQSKQQSDIVRQKKEEYDAAVKTYGAMSGQAGIAYNAYQTEKAKLDVILDELVAQGKITQAYADQLRSGEKIKKTLQEQVKGIADQFSQLSSGWGEFESMMSNFGVEFPEEIGGALSGLSQASGGISKIVNGDIIGGLFSTISGVGNTIASIFGFGNKDNKLQKRIEEQERAIKRLQWAYEDLKESMDNAMSAADLLINKDDMIDNLNATNASLRSMISMEQSKKHTDSGKIDEWQRQIQENNKAIKELEQTVTEQMGGFGSESNFKSAAQEFADAWVDAFNEGSDSLEALEGKFDDYFNNLLKKQLMMRAADAYIKPILAAFDAAVAEGSAGGNNGLDVTEEELNRIKELKDTNLALFDEYAKGLMEILGVSPTTSASLSDLQQGIQSLSESTGQAIESLLNSIRFFVAQQSTDVAAIRQLLAAGSSLNTTTDTNTPMLKELQAQTNYLSKIYSMLGSVVKAGGHPKAGAGIKVFQD